MPKTTKKPSKKSPRIANNPADSRATKKRPATSRLAKGISRGVTAGRGTDPARVKAILEKLDEAYPAATCALKHHNAFQLLIATILSAQCTDERVNMVTPGLFKKYPNPQAFAYANPADIQNEIRSTGFYRNKTKSIIGASKKIVEDFHGEVPRTMEELLTLPGVARKTANVVLGCAFGIASGVVVDTHVLRLSGRLDLTKNTDPKKVELDLMKIIPQDRWILFSHQLIWHGRRICNARNPKCIECNLEKLCYSKDKTV
jgi:endonuclease-3